MLHNSKDLGFRTTNRVDRLFGTSVIAGSSADLDEAKILAGPEGKYILGVRFLMCPVFSSRFGQAYEGVDTRWMCVVFVVEPDRAPVRLCQQTRGPPHHDQSVPPTASIIAAIHLASHVECSSPRATIVSVNRIEYML
jgi:hypothetical protein